MTKVKENWKDILGYEGYYQVSDLGRVKRLAGFVKQFGGGTEYRMERILKQSYEKNKYKRVSLSINSKATTKKVHRLVMLAFVGESHLAVNHKDFNKENNKLENLEYLSNRFNSIHYSENFKKKEVPGSRKYKNGKYQVQIYINGTHEYLGTFPNAEKAREAYYNKVHEIT